MTDLQIKESLHNILEHYAPTRNAQEICNAKLNIHAASINDYIIALADGLKYGNWPWVTHYNKPISHFEMHYIGCPAYNGAFGTCNCVKMSEE